MSKLFHPDRATDAQLATEKFQVLNKAYEILIDPIKRQKYDANGKIDCDENLNVFVVSNDQLAKCKENYAGEKYKLEWMRRNLFLPYLLRF